jgi:hypothetical protein
MIRDSQETLRAVLARARGTIGDREFNSPMEAVYAWLGDFSHIKVQQGSGWAARHTQRCAACLITSPCPDVPVVFLVIAPAPQ